jgi:uroporphyrinogen-III synthase
VRLLITRPEPECARTAARLRRRGYEVLAQALLRIEPVGDAELGGGPWAAVLFTSANAVRAVAVHRRFAALAGLPACTVGQRTQAAAAAAGFAPVLSANGDVDALARLIEVEPHSADRPLLYCAAEDRAGDLAGALQARGIRVETVCVYRAALATDLSPQVRTALAGGLIDAILHYSARTAAAFVAAATTAGVRDLSIRARHLCLSAQVAAPLVAAGATAVDIAREPNEEALFALIAPSLSAPSGRG